MLLQNQAKDQTRPPILVSVNLQLQKIIQDYLGQYKNITVNGLAIKCGVPEATLRRMVQVKTKTVPSTANIVSVLTYILKAPNLTALIDRLENPLADHLKQQYQFIGKLSGSTLSEDERNNQQALMRVLFQNKVAYHTFRCCLHRQGTTEKFIESVFGKPGVEALESLLLHKFIFRRQDKFYSVASNPEFPADLFKENFKSTADYIVDKTSNGERHNLFANLTQSVNEAAYAEIIHIQRESLHKILKVLQNSTSDGDIPCFVLSGVDHYSEPETKRTN